MFSSQQTFAVNGDKKENLKLVLELAFKLNDRRYSSSDVGIDGFKLDEKQGLIFAWMPKAEKEYKGYTRYPMPISLDMAVEIVWSYLQSNEAGDIYDALGEPDNDGSVDRGWLVYAPLWYGEYEVDEHFYAIVGIRPDWIIYGK
jgi:hypothetical protein